MGQKSGPVKEPAEQLVKEIRRATRRQFSAENKIGIVLASPSCAAVTGSSGAVPALEFSCNLRLDRRRLTFTTPHLENTSSLSDGISRLTHKNSSRREH